MSDKDGSNRTEDAKDSSDKDQPSDNDLKTKLIDKDAPNSTENTLLIALRKRRQNSPEMTKQPKVSAAKPASKAPEAAKPAQTAPHSAAVPHLCGVPLKWISLVALTFQTSWQAFAIKLSRSASNEYLNSTIVLFAELLKLCLSTIFFAIEDGKGLRQAVREILSESYANGSKTFMLGVPALAYVIQNNLIFFSLDRLSAAVQQITYQLKILTAALLSVTMLGKVVTCKQWLSLLVLVIGVVCVQFPDGSDFTVASLSSLSQVSMTALLGFSAVLAACFVSGFAGVFMEKVLKGSPSSIWLRNAQLAFFGTLMAIGGIISQDSAEVARGGLLQGYCFAVWVAVATTACGGLLVAAVLKYADNILRQFSTALSISITTFFSAFAMKDVKLDEMFIVGTALAIGATFSYSGVLKWPSVPDTCDASKSVRYCTAFFGTSIVVCGALLTQGYTQAFTIAFRNFLFSNSTWMDFIGVQRDKK